MNHKIVDLYELIMTKNDICRKEFNIGPNPYRFGNGPSDFENNLSGRKVRQAHDPA